MNDTREFFLEVTNRTATSFEAHEAVIKVFTDLLKSRGTKPVRFCGDTYQPVTDFTAKRANHIKVDLSRDKNPALCDSQPVPDHLTGRGRVNIYFVRIPSQVSTVEDAENLREDPEVCARLDRIAEAKE